MTAHPDSFFSTIDELEQLVVDEASLDASTLLQRLSERQRLLDCIQSFDVSTLPQTRHGEVRARLTEIVRDTDRALSKLRARHQTMRCEQDKLVTARTAARGYRPEMRRASRTINKKA